MCIRDRLTTEYSEQELERKAVDLVDSALLFTVSFLLFSVFAKPLIKAIQQRIWNSRALKVQALLVVAMIWWRRREWVRKRVPKIAMVEDNIGVLALWLARSHADRVMMCVGVLAAAVAVWVACTAKGVSWKLRGVVHKGTNGFKHCAEPELKLKPELSAPGRTKMLKLPWSGSELSQLVVAIDEVRAKQRCTEQLKAPAAPSMRVPVCPSSCPALANSRRVVSEKKRAVSRGRARPAKREEVLYASVSGKTFHQEGCRHISRGGSAVERVTLEQIAQRKLRVCGTCR
eukprot:TRINITY_DN39721_c0_g1_i1.p1 TRINITY_DN39721_c0_g1~~TRINITY_DN39721_c0_g1_i1.p1  ORF type:complete len:288 (+),score=68.59 TRINITY_DN39721_c0_g1_i1:98-961(+)